MNGAKLAVGLVLIGAIGGVGFALTRSKKKAVAKQSAGSSGVNPNLPPVTAQVATGYAPVVYAPYDASKIGTHLNLLDVFRYQGTVFYA